VQVHPIDGAGVTVVGVNVVVGINVVVGVNVR